ncbi:MAG: tyrosine-type recombinase/integrase [Thermoplasmataceae archaeon]
MMQNKHLDFDKYGAVLKVPLEGKTVYRQVRVVGLSVPYLREWQNAHPRRDEPDAPLFCGLETNNYGKKLEYNHVYKALRMALKRAGISRRIYPHMFRHTRATILSTSLSEVPLESQMGWVHGP